MALLNRYLEKTPKESYHKATIAYLAQLDHLQETSPFVAQAIIEELKSQRSHLKLIASENYTSLPVQMAMGNWLTDKYAEGYPFHRFYAGCEHVDALEARGADLLKKIFNVDHAYIQPHSGADANLVAFWAILNTRVQKKELEALGNKTLDQLSKEEHEQLRTKMLSQKIMGMSLGSGGHLTHGYRHNVSSKIFESVSYEVDPQTGLINYDDLEKQVIKEKPLILLAGYSAYPRALDFERLRHIADKVGAVLMVDMAHFAGLVAGQAFQGKFNPTAYADILTGTTHKTLRGPRGGFVLCRQEFEEYVNKGCPTVLGGPLPHVLAAKVVAFEELSLPSFSLYAAQIVKNAQSLAQELIKEGISVLTGGTDNHLVLIDLRPFSLTGRQAEQALREAKLTVNRNSIPQDPNGPWYTSGIRLGVPAITTLGMKEEDMKFVAAAIAKILKNTHATITKTGQPHLAKYTIVEQSLIEAQTIVSSLLKRFPLYPEIEI